MPRRDSSSRNTDSHGRSHRDVSPPRGENARDHANSRISSKHTERGYPDRRHDEKSNNNDHKRDYKSDKDRDYRENDRHRDRHHFGRRDHSPVRDSYARDRPERDVRSWDKHDSYDPRADPRSDPRADPRSDPRADPRNDPRADTRRNDRTDPRSDPRRYDRDSRDIGRERDRDGYTRDYRSEPLRGSDRDRDYYRRSGPEPNRPPSQLQPQTTTASMSRDWDAPPPPPSSSHQRQPSDSKTIAPLATSSTTAATAVRAGEVGIEIMSTDMNGNPTKVVYNPSSMHLNPALVPMTRPLRRIFVSNLPLAEPPLNIATIKAYFDAYMKHIGFKTPDPIVDVVHTPGTTYTFIELRSVADVIPVFALMSNAPMGPNTLKLARPKDYIVTPPHLANYIVGYPAGSYQPPYVPEDLLASIMARPGLGGAHASATNPATGINALQPSSNGVVTTVIEQSHIDTSLHTLGLKGPSQIETSIDRTSDRVVDYLASNLVGPIKQSVINQRIEHLFALLDINDITPLGVKIPHGIELVENTIKQYKLDYPDKVPLDISSYTVVEISNILDPSDLIDDLIFLDCADDLCEHILLLLHAVMNELLTVDDQRTNHPHNPYLDMIIIPRANAPLGTSQEISSKGIYMYPVCDPNDINKESSLPTSHIPVVGSWFRPSSIGSAYIVLSASKYAVYLQAVLDNTLYGSRKIRTHLVSTIYNTTSNNTNNTNNSSSTTPSSPSSPIQQKDDIILQMVPPGYLE